MQDPADLERDASPRRDGHDVQRIRTVDRETGLVEIRPLVLAEIVDTHGQFGLADPMSERQPDTRAVATCIVERRLGTAQIGGVFVEADRWLDTPGAGKAHILPVNPHAQVERAVGARPAHVSRVVDLLVPVVGTVAIGGKPVCGGVESESLVCNTPGKLAFQRVVTSDATVHLRVGARLQRRTCDDVDDPGRSAVAVQHGTGSAQDLDSFDRG